MKAALGLEPLAQVFPPAWPSPAVKAVLTVVAHCLLVRAGSSRGRHDLLKAGVGTRGEW